MSFQNAKIYVKERTLPIRYIGAANRRAGGGAHACTKV